MENLEKVSVNHLVEKYKLNEDEIDVSLNERDRTLVAVFQTDKYLYKYGFSYTDKGTIQSKTLQKDPLDGGKVKLDQSPTGQNSPSQGSFSELFRKAHSLPDENKDNPDKRVKKIERENKDNPDKRVKKLEHENKDNPIKRVKELELENAELKKEIKRLSNFEEKMKSRRTITQEQIDLIKRLLAEGEMTQAEIVKLSNTSNGTVWRVKNNMI